MIAFHHQKRLIESNKKKIDILHSLKAELIAIKALIAARKQDILKCMAINPPEEVSNYKFIYLPVTYSYFEVYNNSASKLGIIDDKQLIVRLICGYADIKGLWENIKDLEYYSKKGIEISINNKDILLHQTAVQTHYHYINQIIFEQLPNVEKVINDCINHIDLELSKLR